jgi:hypothetical protein
MLSKVHDIHENLSYHFTKFIGRCPNKGVLGLIFSDIKKISHIAEYHLIYGTLLESELCNCRLAVSEKLCHLKPINALKLFGMIYRVFFEFFLNYLFIYLFLW